MITDLDETLKQVMIQKGAIDPAGAICQFREPIVLYPVRPARRYHCLLTSDRTTLKSIRYLLAKVFLPGHPV